MKAWMLINLLEVAGHKDMFRNRDEQSYIKELRAQGLTDKEINTALAKLYGSKGEISQDTYQALAHLGGDSSF